MAPAIAICASGLLAAALALAAAAPADPAPRPLAGTAAWREGPHQGPRPRWALVLSGGGARGLAHIGVLRLLEEEGLRPDAVFGTSMGALIGALYASGYSSAEIEARFVAFDWSAMFQPTSAPYEWRDIALPRPWITLAGTGRGLRLPPGIVDDANLDHELARALLDAEARAGGDFSRLPIPFRAVATDAATLAAVTLERGLLAQAVRASIAVPVVFPPVVMDGRLLVDGGTAATVPIVPAREAGFDTLLAVDVSRPQVPLTEQSSALQIGLSLLERVIKRGQPADLRPGEQLVWLDLPRISPADFTGSRAMIDWTIAHARDEVRSFAARLRGEAGPASAHGSAASDTTPTAQEPPGRARLVADPMAGLRHRGRDFAPSAAPPLRLPPLRRLSWTLRDGSPARHESSARALFGRAPRDSFAPVALGPGLARVHRGSLFTGAWPRFEVRGDSTDVTFVVTEQEPSELRIAAAWEDDREGRANAAWILRPAGPTPLRRLVIAGTVRRYGALLFASAEPHALERGAPGGFARAALQRERTRVFVAEDRWSTVTVDRIEGYVGRQLPLVSGDVLQAGLGAGRVEVAGAVRAGPMAALRIESAGRLQRSLRCTGMIGPERYGSLALGLAFESPGYPVTLRPAVGIGLATRDAPPDEWHGLGGPDSFGGLRRGEWLGRRRLWAEVRASATLVGVVRAHAAAQAGRVDDAIGRADLPERFRVAAVAGLAMDVPFGPLRVDWGMSEDGQSRWDVQFGQAF